MIRVIDIFAGPGGLSEGFSSVLDENEAPVFEVALSIEADSNAFETLKLRTFFRHLHENDRSDYYKYLRQEISRADLYKAHEAATKEAESKCWHAKLGPGGQPAHEVHDRIDKAVGSVNNWVLIGGPPCQAYSVAGRSRNQAIKDYDPKEDVRQRLYVEYLQILADHQPAIFILENVKGLLSATLENEKIFHRILTDLRHPASALARDGRNLRREKGCGYRIYSLVEPHEFTNGTLKGAVIQAEKYGIPQARHRVILLGVRDDLKLTPQVLVPQDKISVASVIKSLPALRSGLSRIEDSAESWASCLRLQVDKRWANAGTTRVDDAKLSNLIRRTLKGIVAPVDGRGGEFVRCEASTDYEKNWYIDEKICGVCNHSTRGHMEKDLYRYMYAACYAKLHDKSPSLQHFPTDLLPDHVNVGTALEEGGNFSDRFRVQVFNNPGTTVVSHISKDGHYYIHPDPAQCRSFTVREAARLQTFPDNYFFCGPKTAQYIQVGNAVPPLLARQIGRIIYDVLLQESVID